MKNDMDFDPLQEAGALVLERRTGESIWIGSDIKITVYQCLRNSDRMKILIEAPKNILILRDEIRGKPHEPKANRAL